MAQRAGSADLPLNGGRVPAWPGRPMTQSGVVVVEAIILEYGPTGCRGAPHVPGHHQRVAAERAAWL